MIEMSQWYTLLITYNGNTIFNGFFVVNISTGAIGGVYTPDNSNFNLLAPNGSWNNINNTYIGGVFGNLGLSYLPYFAPTMNTVYSFYGNSGSHGTLSQMNGIPNNIIVYYTINPMSSPPFVCFKEGSKILTDLGYRPIQELRKGDRIKTHLHGFIPIDMIGARDIYHPCSKERIKDQLYVCSHDKYPDIFEDLVITGCHSILIDEFKDGEREKSHEVNGDIFITDDKYRLPACVDERTRIYEKEGVYTIYHIALENSNYYENYGIYANGLLVETCSRRYLKELSNMTLLE